MPFTPFHFGPGSFVKSLSPRWFSLRVFILSQVIIDCETAWNIYFQNERLHTFLHTFVGSIVAIALTLVAAWMARSWMRLNGSWIAAVSGATVGAWSHVVLDSIMHADMQPFYPWSTANPLLRIVSLDLLHLACLAGFLAAGAVYFLRSLFRGIRGRAR